MEEYTDIFLKYIIPTVASIGTIYFIGNKIKDALCKQITDLTIELRTHSGISARESQEFEELKDTVNSIIRKNDLAV